MKNFSSPAFLLTLALSFTALSSCASNSATPAPGPQGGANGANSGSRIGNGNVTRSIQNTASTVGIVRNIQSILRGF